MEGHKDEKKAVKSGNIPKEKKVKKVKEKKVKEKKVKEKKIKEKKTKEKKVREKINKVSKRRMEKLENSNLDKKLDKVVNQRLKLTISLKILLVFIPSILIMLLVLGITASMQASSLFKSELETNSKSTIAQTQLYLDSVSSQIESITNSIANNSAKLNSNGKGLFDVISMDINKLNSTEKANFTLNIQNSVLKSVQGQNNKITSVWIARDKQLSVGLPKLDPKYNNGGVEFSKLKANEIYKTMDEKDYGKFVWVPLHEEELVLTNPKKVISLARMMRSSVKVNGTFYGTMILLNLDPSILQGAVDSFSEINENDANIMILDSEGNVLVHSDPSLIYTSLINEKYVQEAFNSESDLDSFEYGNSFVAYSKSKLTGWTVITVTPLTILEKSISKLQLSIIIIGIVLLVAASFVTTLLTLDFSRAIRSLRKSMKKVASGDLTVKSKLNRGDEFMDLSETFDIMVNNVRELIQKSANSSENVNQVSDRVFDTSNVNLETTKQISIAIESVASGLDVQVSNVNESIEVAENLSKKIIQVIECSDNVAKSSDVANVLSSSGKEKVQELIQSSNEMNSVLKNVVGSIVELGNSSNAISEIVTTIAKISDETNLLSLNSSIEAARAGEAGKGFAVVAGEVGKLAGQSAEAANEIDKIITEIKKRIENTKNFTNDVYRINKKQEVHVENTKEVFDEISHAIESIQAQIHSLSQAIKDMSEYKNRINRAIDKISIVADDSAAATEEISASIIEQERSMAELTDLGQKLNKITSELKSSIDKFNM